MTRLSMTTFHVPALLVLALAACTLAACNRTSPPESMVVAPEAGTDAATAQAGTALTGFHWNLIAAHDADGQPLSALTPDPQRALRLDFADDRISVSGGCNRINGGYRIENDRLHVDALAQTRRACEPALMEADAAIAERLEATPELRRSEGLLPSLSLRTSTGETLVFRGVETAQTRYGGEGKTVFLEVAASTRPCSHPLIPDKQFPDMQCLGVREVHYDDAGLKTGTPGDWQPLYQDIEGYTHTPGVRNVVRVKRYEVRDPPADAPSQAYVLDMVVESEVVGAAE